MNTVTASAAAVNPYTAAAGKTWVAFVVLVLLTLSLTTANAQSLVTDDRGVTTRWVTAPQRVITLLPSLTETVCALEQCARLVGVDRYSNWPAQVTLLPTLGGGMDPNIEAIMSLKPDVVFTAQSSRIAERLEALGLKVVALETTSHADVQRLLEKVSQVLGVDPQEAKKLWHRIDEGVSTAAQQLPANTQQLRVYIEVNRAPFGAGPQSFIGETLSRLGAQNILQEQSDAFPRINPEFVIRAQPDLIMISEHDLIAMLERPGWSAMAAIKSNRICAFATIDQDILVRPGPRLPQAAQIMADCLKRFTR
ncbi:MAG: helical backbone metal receptor [Alcaligenaceae bacterium]